MEGVLTYVCYSWDDDVGGEAPIHPADVISWDCVDEVSSSFVVTCDPGCADTNAPSPVTPSPTSGPLGGGEAPSPIVTPSPSTAGIGDVAPPSSTPSPSDLEVDSPSSSSPLDRVGVWVGIVSGVAGTAALAVAAFRHFWKKRRRPEES